MPSGSHGGGGGSHGGSFGGGGSHGSSFGGGSHRGGRPFRPRTFIFFGRSYNADSKTTKRASAISAIVFLLIFFSVFAGILLGAACSSISQIKEDQAYYKQMISMGNITTATVTDMFANHGKYYITYEIAIPNSSRKLEGYSYSVYTREEAARLLYNVKTINVAVNCSVSSINLRTDSIPTDYYYMPLSQDGEYVENANMRTGCIVSLCIFGAGIIACIVWNYMLVRKTKKEEKELAEVFNKPATKRCAYCGSTMSENDKVCAACGSRMQK